jgi:hypothetical protein
MYIAKTDSWYLERVLHLIAGIMILVSLGLAYFFSNYWLILAGLVGLNLIIFSLTGFCLMANILVKLGVRTSLK